MFVILVLQTEKISLLHFKYHIFFHNFKFFASLITNHHLSHSRLETLFFVLIVTNRVSKS